MHEQAGEDISDADAAPCEPTTSLVDYGGLTKDQIAWGAPTNNAGIGRLVSNTPAEGETVSLEIAITNAVVTAKSDNADFWTQHMNGVYAATTSPQRRSLATASASTPPS